VSAGLSFRVVSRADLPAVLALYAQLGQDDGTTLSVSEAEALWEDMEAHPDHRIWVAEEDGVVVGTFSLLRMVNLAHRGAPSAVLEDVVVDASRRGRGVGRAMMLHALAVARSKGCYKLALSSNGRRVDAHRFYESLGFRRHGISLSIDPEAHDART
jgi:GNAT superfamily N-acetyltransferase